MAEWDPTTYDPDAEARDDRRREDRMGSRHGVDRDTVNAWLRAIWIDFERKLELRCQEFWRQTGLSVPDATKNACRRKLHEKLRAEFGRSLPDKDWTEALEQKLLMRGGKAA
jgi:hypothetical protein